MILCTYQWFSPGNLVGNEVVHQDEEGEGGGAANPREVWHFQVFKCQFVHPCISIVSQIPTLWDELIGAHKALWQHSASLGSNY